MRAIELQKVLFLIVASSLFVITVFFIMSFYKVTLVSWADYSDYIALQDAVIAERIKYCIFLYLYNKTLIDNIIKNPSYLKPGDIDELKNQTYFFYIVDKKTYEEISKSKDFQEFMKKCIPLTYIQLPNYSYSKENNEYVIKGHIIHVYSWYQVRYENLFNASDNFTVGPDYKGEYDIAKVYSNIIKALKDGLFASPFTAALESLGMGNPVDAVENFLGVKCKDPSNYQEYWYVYYLPTLEVDAEGNLYRVKLIKVTRECEEWKSLS